MLEGVAGALLNRRKPHGIYLLNRHTAKWNLFVTNFNKIQGFLSYFARKKSMFIATNAISLRIVTSHAFFLLP